MKMLHDLLVQVYQKAKAYQGSEENRPALPGALVQLSIELAGTAITISTSGLLRFRKSPPLC